MGAGHTKNTGGEIEVPMLESLLNRDPWLKPYEREIRRRFGVFKDYMDRIDSQEGGLKNFTSGYLQYGMVVNPDNSVTWREWAPGAHQLYLTGDFNDWDRSSLPFTRLPYGKWELHLPANKDGSCPIPHLSETKLVVRTYRDELQDRISPWAKYVIQPSEDNDVEYRQLAWNPPSTYEFEYDPPKKPENLKIYECHVGICTSEPKIGTYKDFAWNIINIAMDLGYNAIQLMAIMEHAYYASFGYQVTSFFAVSSRFGTPEELKHLIDTAHKHGIYVLLDVVHSHASKNVYDGLNQFDGTNSCYFHDGPRGEHPLWDSRLFNYSEMEVLRFLLSNLRWYVEEYHFDGFRFDGVTSMIYHSRGVGESFTGEYSQYFGLNVDCEGLLYVMLANYMLHDFYPNMITIAEEVSGMPGCCRPVFEGGLGFDYRLGMGIPDMWVKLVRDVRDEDWSMGEIVHTLTNRRYMEKTIAYVESHDQALVGDKTLAFWLMDKEMYTHMSKLSEPNIIIDRGIALHKMIRLITHTLGGEGYLNFMGKTDSFLAYEEVIASYIFGDKCNIVFFSHHYPVFHGNEFGHPEWLDFPRPGNDDSFHYARRQWNLVKDKLLKYVYLFDFDRTMNKLEQRYQWLTNEYVHFNLIDEKDKTIAFEKGDLLFVFNFNPVESFPNYPIVVNRHATYFIVLCSDEKVFGGFDRVDIKLEYETIEDFDDGKRIKLLVYIPSRTVSVFERRILPNEDP